MFNENTSSIPGPKPVIWEYQLRPCLDSIREARQLVRDSLEAHADPGTLGDVELVVSELVTNAVRHGPGKPINLRLATEPDGVLSGEVADQGDGVIAIRGWQPDGVGGLGLPIVDRLTTAWGVYAGSTHVWFRFDP